MLAEPKQRLEDDVLVAVHTDVDSKELAHDDAVERNPLLTNGQALEVHAGDAPRRFRSLNTYARPRTTWKIIALPRVTG